MHDELEIVILAGGGHAAEVFCYLDCAKMPVRLLGIIDEMKPPGDWEGTRILGGFDALAQILLHRSGAPLGFITAIGNNRLREQFVSQAQVVAAGVPLVAWTLRHPYSFVGHCVEIGEGTLLAPGSLVTTRSRIGKHCILNVKSSVSHDCTIGDFVNLNPGCTVCGNVQIGEGAFIGAGATIINGVSVGAWTIVGAGAVVVKNLPPYVTAVGVPARVIKCHSPHES